MSEPKLSREASASADLAVPGNVCNAGVEGQVIPVDIAAAKAVAVARTVQGIERIALLEAVGRILAHDVVASLDLPPFDNSAMDGYAVRCADLAGDGPWHLSLAGRIAAGEADPFLGTFANAAVRIFTGAPVPPSFDAVVMQELCENDADQITFRKRPRFGENIRRAGEDVRTGRGMLSAGDLLTPQRLALLAGQGLADVEVRRKVRIGLISTGSELREPGEILDPGQIFNSNRVMIRSMLAPCSWADTVDFGIIPDQRKALCDAFSDASRCCDVLVTTGGVSAGEEDHVVSAFDSHGGKLDVLKVAMRPGKPVKIGLIGTMLFAGLPGNPNAALVTFRQIALPAIRTIAGLSNAGPEWSPAVAGFTYEKRLGRTEFVPIRVMDRDELGRPVLDILGRGSSASLSAMAMADGIAMLPPELSLIESGAVLSFEPLRAR